MTDDIDEVGPLPAGSDRRQFVKRIVAGTAFAVPIVTSFDMEVLRGSTAHAQANQAS